MSSLARIVSGRRSKWIVLAAWVMLVVGLGPFAGKFEKAQQNEPSSFLPGSAESVEVLELDDAFPGGEATPAIAIFRNPDGLGEDDRSAIEAVRDAVAGSGAEGVRPPGPSVLSERRG